MKILLIHNKYQQVGGEDTVFHAEGELLQNNGHLVEFLVFDNKEIITWFDKLLSGIYLIYNPVSARTLRRKIKLLDPDVIHIHNFVPLASPSVFFVAKEFDKPVVLTLHNYRLLCPSTTLYVNNQIYERSIDKYFPLDAIIKGVYRNSILQTAALVMMTLTHKLLGTWQNKIDAYIVLTRFALSKFNGSTLGIRPDQFFIKSNFVEEDNLPDCKREDFFLFVGRLTNEKGIRTLLESTKLLSYDLTIIGGGPLEDMVREYASENSRIKFLGFQPRGTILEIMKKCKALIFPSVWYEGFPMTILEAFSKGTPVIASRLGSMEEVVHDRINGLHFKAGCENDLASKVKILMEDSQLVSDLSKNASETYRQNYTPSKNYHKLIEIYNKVIEANSDQ